MILAIPNEYGVIIGEPVATREWKDPTSRGAVRLDVYQTAAGYYPEVRLRSRTSGMLWGAHDSDPVYPTRQAAMEAAIDRARRWFVDAGDCPAALDYLDTLRHEPLELPL